jgi:type IV pilus assembly protein PilM
VTVRQLNRLRKLTASALVGVEIGSFAVRAAEVTVAGPRPSLRRFAQVDLPAGAVVDGEVMDVAAVSAALRRLWAEGRFSGRRVVVGVSGQRVIVRQADLPAMSEQDLHSALKFEAQDLIPIPTEQALLDFTVVNHLLPGDEGLPPQMRILLAAAHRDMVAGHLAALKGARLEPVAVDVAALAMLRAVPVATEDPLAGGSVDAVVSIGADLTTVAIRERGVARFVRILNVGGGSTHADSLPEPALVPGPNVANGSSGPAAVAVAERAPAMAPERLVRLVEEVQSSLDFYLAQADGDRIDLVLVTGGATQIDGVMAALTSRLSSPVRLVDPSLSLIIGRPGLTEDEFARAAPTLVTPVGLALWGAGTQRQISLLPAEVGRAKRTRRTQIAAACAAAAVVCAFGAVWASRSSQVARYRNQTAAAQTQVAAQQAQISALSGSLAIRATLTQRQQLYAGSLGQDADWIRLMQQVYAVQPEVVTLVSVGLAGSAAPAAAAGAPSSIGTLTISATTTAGLPAVANWIRAIQTNPALTGLSLTALSPGVGPLTGHVAFSATAKITDAALSQRFQDAAKAKP